MGPIVCKCEARKLLAEGVFSHARVEWSPAPEFGLGASIESGNFFAKTEPHCLKFPKLQVGRPAFQIKQKLPIDQLHRFSVLSRHAQ